MTATITPRSVFCVVEHAHRDRHIAEDVCHGRFSHQGHALDLGVEPDWLGAALPIDREWRLEWTKFYYGLDLAWAFRVTGDQRFLTTWERLVLSWIRQVPVAFDPCDVIGRRMQNWIYAWCSFAASERFPGLTPGTDEAIVESLQAQVSHLGAHLTRERNHRTLELYALFIVSLALPTIDPGGHVLASAIEQLRANLLLDIGPDGVQRERSTHYHHVVLRSFLGARENARRFGLDFGAEFDERLGRACDFALHVHRPDGSIPALSDSDSGSYLDLLALAADLFGRSDWRYVATRGRAGTAPARTNVSFPHGGYFVQRSGWGSQTSFEAERFLIFDCGPIGDGGHGHYDALSIDVASRRPLVVDPGRFTYCDEPPHWRRWFKSTAAHNTVTVDGHDQTPYHRGKPRSGTATARLIERVTDRELDVLCGEVVSPAYEVIHRRRILFVRRQYWIVHDTLVGAEPHTYALRFHLAPADDDRPLVTIADGSGVRAPGLELIVGPPWPITVEPGWVSRTYGVKEPSPVVVATAENTASAEFFSLLMPIDEDVSSVTRFDISRSAQANEELLIADVSSQTGGRIHHDRVMWAVSGGLVS
jgi:Heparinase II/III-like protein/Heparinase II/III N-terminus